jgi:hypothetical protein
MERGGRAKVESGEENKEGLEWEWREGMSGEICTKQSTLAILFSVKICQIFVSPLI